VVFPSASSAAGQTRSDEEEAIARHYKSL